MARSEQVEWADHADRKQRTPPGRFHEGDHILYTPAQHEADRELERARARRYVTRWADARGDVAAGAEVLDALGLEAA